MDVLTDIPAWLIGLGLVGIAALMVWSISKGTPFLIHDKKWGVDGRAEESGLTGASENQAELATRLEALEERPVPEATEVDPLVATKLEALSKDLANVRSEMRLVTPSVQEAFQVEVEEAVQADIAERLEALERKQGEMAEQLSQLTAAPEANPESGSGSNSGDQGLLDVRRLNLQWEAIDSIDYEIFYTKAGSAMVSKVEQLMLSAGVTKKPRCLLVLDSYFSGELDTQVAMQYNALSDQNTEVKRAWATILTFLEFPLGDMTFAHAKDVNADTLRWCLQ